MNLTTKQYIDSLDKRSIPWRRMFTAYGTAENYCEYLSVLEQTLDGEAWKTAFRKLSDFEHQGTFFPRRPLRWFSSSEFWKNGFRTGMPTRLFRC